MNIMGSLEEDISLPREGNNGACLSHYGTVPPLNNSSFDFCTLSLCLSQCSLPYLSANCYGMHRYVYAQVIIPVMCFSRFHC